MALDLLTSPEITEALKKAPPHQAMAYAARMAWLAKAHDHQKMPPGDWWSILLLLAGRGAGKTRTAAEQIWWWAWQYPNTRWLVSAPTSSDVRSTTFEGDSGLMSVIPPVLVADYNKALHELKLVNGSLIKGIPASEPERFRGPQFHGGWCCPPDTMIALPNGGEVPIQNIKSGDVVMTRHGPRKVLAAGVSGNTADLIVMRCGDTQLTTTDDHPILVGDQWIPAGKVKEGDKVWRASFTTVSHGTKGQQGTITTKDEVICTGTSGSNTTAQFKKALLFITQITTLRTMTFPILLSWRNRNINGIIDSEQRIAKPKKKPQEKRLSSYALPKLGSALNVVRSLFRFRQTKLGSSAPENVLISGATTGNTHSKQIAQVAVQSSVSCEEPITHAQLSAAKSSSRWEFKKATVKSVERLPNSVTYNLTVEGEHEFIANGIVVHNCDELAAWEYLQEAWDQIMFGMRLKMDANWKTRLICTTTPRPKDLIVDLVSRDGDDVCVTTASTYANIDNLSENFRKQILQYEGTKLGKQEIYAEIIDPEESGIVKRDWFKLWPAQKPLPKLEFIVQSYDCAYTDKINNDPTACITFGVFKPTDGPMSALVIDAWQDRLQYPDMKEKVLEEYEVVYGDGKDARRVDLVLVEDKSAGISLIQDLQRAHVFVRGYNPGKADKIQRLSIVANIIRAGRVWIPESSVNKGYVRDWAEGMVSQICSFPETTHDDFVDAASMALRYLRDAGWLDIDPPPRDELDEDDYVDAGRKKENPYSM